MTSNDKVPAKGLNINDLKRGEAGRIVSVEELDAATAKKFLDLGLLRGEKVIFIQRAPLGDPVWIEIKGYQLALRKDVASKIRIERIIK